MEFTIEQIKQLTKTNKIIKIEGINYLGQEFKTIGTPMGENFIDLDCLGVYLGQQIREKGNVRVNYLTLFNSYKNPSSQKLYIGNIFDEDNNLIYHNKDYGKIAVCAKNYGAACFSKSPMTIENTGAEHLIAKPVIIGKVQAAVKSVRKTQDGAYVLECSNGTTSAALSVNDLSGIQLDTFATSKFQSPEESEA